MTATITPLNTSFDYKIIIPDIDRQYDFNEGLAIAEEHIDKSKISDFAEGKLTLSIIFPLGLEQYSGNEPKILGDFFVGLLGQLINQYKNSYFNDIHHDIDRKSLRDVNQEPTIDDLFNQTFGVAWETCAPIEDVLNQKIRIGAIHENGEITFENSDYPFLYHATNKCSKGFDAIFMSNFSVFDELKSELKPSPFRR
jgi:hypothetical protein